MVTRYNVGYAVVETLMLVYKVDGLNQLNQTLIIIGNAFLDFKKCEDGGHLIHQIRQAIDIAFMSQPY